MLRGKKKQHLTVLSLHRISDERNIFWNPIKPKTFDLLLQYVKKHYTIIGFNNLSDWNPDQSKPPLILSFDDGYYDFYEYALPLLKKHALPSNHNIVNECASNNTTIWTERLNVLFEHALQNKLDIKIEFENYQIQLRDFAGDWMKFYLETFKTLLNLPLQERLKTIDASSIEMSIDSNRRMMNWDEVKECAANGVEIGSHTYSHDSIGTISDSKVLNKEINDSKTEIENKLGREVTMLALPNGQTGPEADRVIEESDYKFVLYANDALNTLPLKNQNTPIHINRINLVDEPFPQMALRMEMFHNLIRKYV